MDKRAGIDDQTASGLAQVNQHQDAHGNDLPEFDYIQENYSPELVTRLLNKYDWIDYHTIAMNYPCPSSPTTYECRCDENIRNFCTQ